MDQVVGELVLLVVAAGLEMAGGSFATASASWMVPALASPPVASAASVSSVVVLTPVVVMVTSA